MATYVAGPQTWPLHAVAESIAGYARKWLLQWLHIHVAGYRRVHGVGILLNKGSYQALSSIEKISDRIIVATFDGNPRCTVIVVYSLTNVSDKDDIDAFYNSLDGLTSAIPSHNVCLLIGDLNARVYCHFMVLPTETVRNSKSWWRRKSCGLGTLYLWRTSSIM